MRDLGGKITHKMLLPFPTHKQNNRYSKNDETVRSVLADYFHGPSQVPLQWDILV